MRWPWQHRLEPEPPTHDKVQRVEALSREIAHEANVLNEALRPFTEEDDPLVALMIRLNNLRALRSNGSDH